MFTQIINRWDAIRGSFWFVPSLMSLGALLLALACTTLEGPFSRWFAEFFPWIGVSTSSARSSLTAIGGAMVSIASIALSVLLVTLSITSSQYGSRLLRTFMADKVTQFTLGLLVGTSLFCMLALAGIREQQPHSTANVSAIVGVALAVASLGALIGFIHHVASLIQAPNVVAAVAHDLNESLDRLFPAQIGEPSRRQGQNVEMLRQLEGGVGIGALQEGYVQAIASESLLQIATQHNLFVRCDTKPGSFVEQGETVFWVWPADLAGVDERLPNAAEPDEALQHQIADTLIAGPRRTIRQDAECALEELVEVAVRALSPGINDPFTAVACVDRLAAAVGRVAERPTPDPLRVDDAGQPRFLARSTTFADLMDSAFNQIRQHGCGCVAVSIRLADAFRRIVAHSRDGAQRSAIRRHAEMLQRDFRRQAAEPEDGDDFQQAYQRLEAALDVCQDPQSETSLANEPSGG
jgi:uncharacterized membrane protein